MLHFERVTSAEHPYYERAMILYRSSFPYHELREEQDQRYALTCEDYHFLLIYDGELFVGLMLFWEAAEFIYLEHFCILEELRNGGYGTKALSLLAQRGKTVILEIDPPVDELSLRRKGFYLRVGYRENGYEHIHPAYHDGFADHRLVLLSTPEELSKEQFDVFSNYLRTVVMVRNQT